MLREALKDALLDETILVVMDDSTGTEESSSSTRVATCSRNVNDHDSDDATTDHDLELIAPATVPLEHLVEAVVVEDGDLEGPAERTSVLASVVNVEEERKVLRRKLCCWLSALIGIPTLLAVVALIVIFVVVIKDGEVSRDETLISGTQAMTVEKRFDIIKSIVQDIVYDGLPSSLLEDETTPQSLALHWMAIEDKM